MQSSSKLKNFHCECFLEMVYLRPSQTSRGAEDLPPPSPVVRDGRSSLTAGQEEYLAARDDSSSCFRTMCPYRWHRRSGSCGYFSLHCDSHRGVRGKEMNGIRSLKSAVSPHSLQ